LENNYAIRIARNSAAVTANDKGKGIAGFLPVIDSNGGYRYDAFNDSTGSPLSFGNSDARTWSSQLSLNWTLFDGFRMFADKRRYDELARLGDQEARNIIEQTVVNIMRAFFNLVQQEQLHDVARNTRDISETRLNREKVRRDLGGASTTDYLNAMVNFNHDQTVLLDRELQVIIARKDLNVLLARDADTPVEVNKEIIIPPISYGFDDLLGRTKKRNSRLQAARHRRAVSQEHV
ncbi:MAG: TolC family protein, partial [Deltaproteobacteria bacterium]|nr:TolC family protein [Deltaproteobacteria bacterium]